jgi:hypothetical protein
MPEHKDDETVEWVLWHEYVARRVASSSSDVIKRMVPMMVEDSWRRGELSYQYRNGNGEFHRDDLSDEFRRQAEIDSVKSSAKLPEQRQPIPNPDFGYVTAQHPGRVHWFRPGPAFGQPEFIETVIPAETITELRLAAPKRAPVEAAPTEKRVKERPASPPRTKTGRLRAVLGELKGDGRLTLGMQPREITKMAKPLYLKEWPAREDDPISGYPDRKTVRAAYKVVMNKK